MGRISDLVIDVIEMHSRGIRATEISNLLGLPFDTVEAVLDKYEAEWDLAFHNPSRDNVLGA